jgi:hypothetical protein
MAFEARQAGAAEGVVLVEDRDLLDLEVFGEVLDPGLGFRVVAGADVDDVLELGVAQEHGAGEGADERHLGGGGDGLRRGCSRRSDRADQGKDLVLLDQLLSRRDRLVRLVAVIDANQVELAAVHAALLVRFLESRADAGAHALAERGGRTFEHGRLAEDDALGGDSVLGARGRKRCQDQGR